MQPIGACKTAQERLAREDSTMKVASVLTCFNEERFIKKHLDHIPDWVEEKVVLLSEEPWYGTNDEPDKSEELAIEAGATLLKYKWLTETSQRNAGQEYLDDYDWILNLEPDEFLSNEDWNKLREFLEDATGDAYAINQRVFWGQGYESDPPEDFVPIIVTRPKVRFIDKRCIDSNWSVLPDITLLHFAWARTDKEIWKKISHYSHAVDFDINDWYQNVWLARKTENVHPTTPEAIPRLKKAILPKEIEELDLWP